MPNEPTLVLAGEQIRPTCASEVKNLEVILDSNLAFKSHISSVCRSTFGLIRHLRRIRDHLDSKSCAVLANSIASSRLDYCNSLFVGRAACTLQKLQRAQNSLARVVTRAKISDHISPILHKLHWLPVKQRITFKVASMVYKSLKGLAPSYIQDLIHRQAQSRSLRSCHLPLLFVPFV